MEPEEKDLLSSGDVCRMCCFTSSKLKRLENEGKLLPYKVYPVSHKRLYKREDVEAYLKTISTKKEEENENEE